MDELAHLRAQAEAHAADARVLAQRLDVLAPGYGERLGVELPQLEADANDELSRARYALELEQRRRDWLHDRYREHEARAQRQAVAAERMRQGIARFSGYDRRTFERLLTAGREAAATRDVRQQGRERIARSDAARTQALELSEADR